MERTLPKPKGIVLFGFLLPGILINLFIIIIPLILAIYFSLYKFTGGIMGDFVGLKNYAQLLQDEKFWNSFKNNLVITGLSIVGQLGFAFVLAIVMQSKWVKFREFHRAVIFLPVVLPAVVVGFVWTLMYNKDYGLLNKLLSGGGLGSWIQPWLDDPGIVVYSVTAPIIWQFIGLYLIIFMSAIQNISSEIYEVAEIDGATGIRKAIYITLPMLADTIKVALMLCIAGNMKIFDNIFVMTGGGPGESSTVMAQYAYNVSFGQFRLGYGSAVSIGMIILSLLLVLIIRRLMGGTNR